MCKSEFRLNCIRTKKTVWLNLHSIKQNFQQNCARVKVNNLAKLVMAFSEIYEPFSEFSASRKKITAVLWLVTRFDSAASGRSLGV